MERSRSSLAARREPARAAWSVPPPRRPAPSFQRAASLPTLVPTRAPVPGHVPEHAQVLVRRPPLAPRQLALSALRRRARRTSARVRVRHQLRSAHRQPTRRRQRPPLLRSDDDDERPVRRLQAAARVPAPLAPRRCDGDVEPPPVPAATSRRARVFRAPIGRECGIPDRRSAAINDCEPARPSGAAARSPRQPRCRTHPPCHAHEACSTRPPTAKRASRRLPGLPRLRRHGFRAPAPDLRYRRLR